jgi:catechol 2,3-dioxygenase-like lactoylglutathione lyase family enzyme
MGELTALDVKAHLPAKDFETSKRFYQDLGFTLCWGNEVMAHLHQGPCGDNRKGFLLQNFYVRELAENLQMHLLVQDVEAWWAHVQAKRIAETYAVQTGPPEDRAWKMRDFILVDPSGVLWRIAQAIPGGQ